MVGRGPELARLEEALLGAQRDDFRVVVLCGEAGVGKTRLVSDLRRRAEAFGFLTLVGECSEADLSLPYLPFVEALSNHLANSEIDNSALRTALGHSATPLARVFPQLGSPGARFSPTDPSLDRLRMYEAMVALLQAVSSQRRILLVVEDVHWADRATQDLLDYLTRRLRTARTMLVVTHRTSDVDRHHPLLPVIQRWRRAGISETVELHPLSIEQVGAMVAAILDVEVAPTELAHVLHARAEGVPFAVEELLRAAVEHGRLSVGADGPFDDAALEAMPPPRSLADSILLRVERLTDDQTAVLRCAAVLGRSFDFPILVELTRQPLDAVLDALDACIVAQLVEEDERDNVYRFRHVLIRDAVYTDMIVSRRRLLHSKAADVLRAARPNDPGELARHLLAGGRFAEAAPVLTEAGEASMLQLAPREACELFERAAAHTSDPREHVRLLCRIGEAWHQAGDVAVAQRYLEEGVAGLDDAGDGLAAAHHRLNLGRCCWERSKYKQAEEHYERARYVLDAAGPSEDLANAYVRLSGLRTFELDPEGAQRLALRAIEIADAAGAVEAGIAGGDWLGCALADGGQLDEGLAQLARSAEQAGERRLYMLQARILSHALSVLESYGRVGESQELLERLHALPSDPWIQVVVPYYEGWVHFWSAQLQSAAMSAKTCVRLAERFGMESQATWGRALLCSVDTELGDLQAARDLLPARDRPLERQELVEQGWVSLRYLLAAAQNVEAAKLAVELSEMPSALAGTALSDTVVEALVADGRVADATRLIDNISAQPRSSMHSGHLLRARGRILAASGDASGAVLLLRSASEAFVRGGYHLEHLRTEIVLADAEAASSDTLAAAAALNDAMAGARACGAAPLRLAANGVATRYGLDLADDTALPSIREDADTGLEAPPASDADGVLLVGERLVTVLFADVRDFTGLTRRIAAADMADRIATMQRWALLAVQRHHGILDKFAGDSLMATFNVTGGHVDHTRHALDVAIGLVMGTAKLELSLGGGIAVGPAVVGHLADGANLSVLGTVTNLAARLQAAARGGEILMSEDAHARVRDSLPAGVASVEPCVLSLKGFDEPVRAVRLSVAL
jgi:class 3 adenylate cyclase/tetratricopeptide (TPR) repeat protein